jgi:hypothetical protein
MATTTTNKATFTSAAAMTTSTVTNYVCIGINGCSRTEAISQSLFFFSCFPSSWITVCTSTCSPFSSNGLNFHCFKSFFKSGFNGVPLDALSTPLTAPSFPTVTQISRGVVEPCVITNLLTSVLCVSIWSTSAWVMIGICSPPISTVRGLLSPSGIAVTRVFGVLIGAALGNGTY